MVQNQILTSSDHHANWTALEELFKIANQKQIPFVINGDIIGDYNFEQIKDELNLKYENEINLETLNPTLSYALMHMGFKYKKIFYSRKKRDHGKSQWTLSKKINLFWDIFIRFSDLPIKIISRFGLFFSLITILYALYIFFMKLIYNTSVEGFATLAILISFLSGIIIFILGLIGEYLIRIYKLVEKTDKVIIEKYIE